MSHITPLIFIPGFLGSEMQAKSKNGTGWWTCWPATEMNLIQMLSCNSNGSPTYESDVKGIIETVTIAGFDVSEIYSSTLKTIINGWGYTKNVNMFIYKYDFRLDIDTNSFGDGGSGQQSLYTFINDVMKQTGSKNVDLLCHGMGGLLALQTLISCCSSGHAGIIRKLVLLGTPVFGAAKAYMGLLCGIPADVAYEYLGYVNWGPSHIQWKHISANAYGAYQLTPSQQLTDEFCGGSFVTINGERQNFEQAYGYDGVVCNDKILNQNFLKESTQWKYGFLLNLILFGYIIIPKTYFFQGTNVATPISYEVRYDLPILPDPNNPASWLFGDTKFMGATATKINVNSQGDGTVLNWGPEEFLHVPSNQIIKFPFVDHLGLATNPAVIDRAMQIFDPPPVTSTFASGLANASTTSRAVATFMSSETETMYGYTPINRAFTGFVMTYDGTYLTCIDGGGLGAPEGETVAITTDATTIGDNEMFFLEWSETYNTFVLQVASGNYVTANRGGGMVGTPISSDAVGPFEDPYVGAWQLLRFVPLTNGKYAIRTAKGFYWSATNGGNVGGDTNPIHTDATSVGDWETFSFVATPEEIES
jgi:hypothetical protein